MVILGTQYAGEMKKGIFTVMHYFMPKRGILSLHSGCNVGAANDVSLFFGLSGAPTSVSYAGACNLAGFCRVAGPARQSLHLLADSAPTAMPLEGCAQASVANGCSSTAVGQAQIDL